VTLVAANVAWRNTKQGGINSQETVDSFFCRVFIVGINLAIISGITLKRIIGVLVM
jgi:hypothetical protein